MNIKTLPTGQGQTNCYLLWGEDFAAVIDPAEPTEDILNFGRANNKKQTKYIILTHCHFDHISGVPELLKVFDAQILACEDEAEGLLKPEINLSGRWSDFEVSLIADIPLSDNDEIKLGEEALKAIKTPGHTVGSICLMGEDFIFTGDTLFNLSVGRYDLPSANVRSLIESLKKIGKSEKNYILYPGHGDKTTLDFEKQHNTFLRKVLEKF